jgi:hypothetical protein
MGGHRCRQANGAVKRDIACALLPSEEWQAPRSAGRDVRRGNHQYRLKGDRKA